MITETLEFINFMDRSHAMNMNRRIALKQLGLVTAGAMLLPGCLKQVRPLSVALNNLSVTGEQEGLLAEMAESIIPATDIPGAKALNLQAFVLRMVDDCQDADAQKNFETGLSQFDEAVVTKFKKPFEECSAKERKEFLLEIDFTAKAERESDKSTPVSVFYSLVKRYTIQGFLNSEYIMTNVLVYNMIPGKFVGCVPVKDKNDIKTVIG